MDLSKRMGLSHRGYREIPVREIKSSVDFGRPIPDFLSDLPRDYIGKEADYSIGVRDGYDKPLDDLFKEIIENKPVLSDEAKNKIILALRKEEMRMLREGGSLSSFLVDINTASIFRNYSVIKDLPLKKLDLGYEFFEMN